MNNVLKSKIIKIHSDFIYVKSNDILFECKIRERLKKEKIKIFVGDNVKIEEINPDTNQAVITEVFERKNFIPRPAIANIDQVIVVVSLIEPKLDFMQLNRYLCLAKLYNIPAVICLNKIDLKNSKNDETEKILSIYKPLGYEVIYTSALDYSGIENLEKCLSGKISVFAGMSGVGKSSILNRLLPELNLRVKTVSSKTKKGVHTTRHVELIDILLPNSQSNCQVADTPGFSHLKFDNIMPFEVGSLFNEIKNLSDKCYFSDCLHLKEENCNVIKNLDKIDKTRYESYKIFLKESFEHKKKIIYSSQKEDEAIKLLDAPDRTKTRIIKLGTRAKELSRRTNKQKINSISISDDIYYNDNDLN